MAIAPVVDGAALIRIAVPSSGSLEDLGYTLNGPDTSFNSYFHDIHSDRQGGDEGPPIEVVFMGEIATITLRLVEWEATGLAKVLANRIAAGTQGTPGTPGTTMFANTKDSRLLINSTTNPYNFPRVIFRDAQEINKGTKHSQALIVATAYENGAGVLWNAVTT